MLNIDISEIKIEISEIKIDISEINTDLREITIINIFVPGFHLDKLLSCCRYTVMANNISHMRYFSSVS